MDTPDSSTAPIPGFRSALLNRNLRLLWIGETISQLGDQFYLIGLPLLIFTLTGSSALLGLILLVEGVPRAVLMLFGGVITDRISPRRVMIASNGARLLITLILAVLILTQSVQIWNLFVAAFMFGAVDAFFQPAFMSMIPALLEPDQLQAGNGLMQSSSQTVQSIGPGLAGAIVAGLGIGVAVSLDALTFLITTVALFAMRLPKVEKVDSATDNPNGSIGSISRDVISMLRYVLNDSILQPYIFLILAINVCLAGPSTVGVVVLAKDRFGGSALAFGVMLSAMGIGSVLGALLTGIVKVKKFGVLFLISIGLNGIFLATLGLVDSLWLTVLLFGFIALLVGFTNVLLLTWFGKQIPGDMMGRFMSLYVLLAVGLAPISNAITGFTFGISLVGTFVAAGLILLIASGLALSNPVLRRMEL